MLNYKVTFIIFLVVLFFLIYQVAYLIFGLENRNSKNIYEKAKVMRKPERKPSYIFSKYIILPEYKRLKWQKALDSLNLESKMTIEEYISDVIYSSIGLFALGFAFIGLVKMGLAIPNELIILILGYAIYKTINNAGKLDRALAYKQVQIEEEAPALIRHFLVSLKSSFDLQSHFENYLPFAKVLKPNIEFLLADVATNRSDQSNMIFALENFADRCNTQIITDFVNGLIGGLNGRNQETYFTMLERDIKELTIDNMMRKNKKIEKKVRLMFFVLIFDFMFFIIMVIGVFFVSMIKGF